MRRTAITSSVSLGLMSVLTAVTLSAGCGSGTTLLLEPEFPGALVGVWIPDEGAPT